MSLQRLSDPRDYVPAGAKPFIPVSTRHPVPVVMQVPALTGGNLRAQLTVQMFGPTGTGSSLSINGNAFTFADAPAFGQLPWIGTPVDSTIPPAPTANQQIIQALYRALQSTPALSSVYEITLDETFYIITLRARENGPKHNFTVVNGGGFLTGASGGASTVPAERVDGLKARVRVFVDEDPVPRLNQFGPYGTQTVPRWKEVGLLEQPFTGQTLEFNLQDTLASWIDPAAPAFSLFPSQWEKWAYVENAARRWYYEATYRFTDANELDVQRAGFVGGRGNASCNFWIAPWGFDPYLNAAEAAERGLEAWGMVQEQPPSPGAHVVQFLTNQPASKRMDIRSIEFLTLHKGITDGYLHLEVDYYFDNGTSITEIVPDFSRQVQGAGIVRVEVSPRCIPNLATITDGYEGLRPYSYTVRVLWSAGSDPSTAVPVSQAQTYLISRDDECDDRFYQLLFLNRLGGYDTLWLGSRVELEQIADRSTFRQPRNPATDSTNADYDTNLQRARMKGRASAGYIDTEAADWLLDLTATPRAFVLAYDGRMGAYNYRLISLDSLSVSVNEFRPKGPESVATLEFTYLIDF